MAKERPTIRCSTEGLTRAEVIVHLFKAFRSLNWDVEHLHPMRIVAVMPTRNMILGDRLFVEIEDGVFNATSKPNGWNPFERRVNHERNLEQLKCAFTEARTNTSADQLAAQLKELNESGVMELDASTARANETSWKDAALLFVPRKGFLATPLLVDISLVVYLLMLFNEVHFMEPSVEHLVAWGGNLRATTLDGELWRLLTCCFVHIGIVHLLLNMYALLMIGVQLEPILGSVRVLVLYVVTGIVASMTSLWWHENTVSAGASGAIFGLYGVFLALLFTDLIPKETRKQLLQSIGIFVLYNLMYGLKGGVDNAAHIGGLVSGLVLGLASYSSVKHDRRGAFQLASIGLPALMMLGGGAFVIGKLPADDPKFYAVIDDFQRLEQRGLAPFRLPEEATRVQQLIIVQDSALSAWREAVELLGTTNELKLSDALAEKREQFKLYADVRLENMELLEQALLRDDDSMSVALQESFARVDSILLILNAEE